MASFIGIDVSKGMLDGYATQRGSKRFKNSEVGYNEFLQWLEGIAEAQIILEATGGYERRFVEFLSLAGVSFSVVNPKRTRAFARSLGVQAKTDILDSKLLAKYGTSLAPAATQLPSSEVRELNELVSRRLQLVDLQTQEKNRLEHVEGYTLKDVRASIAWLGKRVSKIDKEIAGLVLRAKH
jgi:transposase